MRVIDLFRDWDDDGDGMVSQKEFTLTVTLARALTLTPAPDTDPNANQVSKKEFRKAMTALGLSAPRKDVDGLFDTFDPDGGGSIDYKELLTLTRTLTLTREARWSP